MLRPAALAASMTGVAALIAEGLTADELALVGAAFAMLGDALSLMSVAAQQNEDQEKNEGC